MCRCACVMVCSYRERLPASRALRLAGIGILSSGTRLIFRKLASRMNAPEHDDCAVRPAHGDRHRGAGPCVFPGSVLGTLALERWGGLGVCGVRLEVPALKAKPKLRRAPLGATSANA